MNTMNAARIALCVVCMVELLPITTGLPPSNVYLKNSISGWLSSSPTSSQPSTPSVISVITPEPEMKEDETGSVPDQSPSGHPFVRDKRDVNCPIQSYIPAEVLDRNTFLNSTMYLGLNPQQPALSPLPEEGLTCPNETGSWWPRPETNLKSTCPWVFEYNDFGESYYPRYVFNIH